MKERKRFRPFTHDEEDHIVLGSPQLALVVCQLRWPLLTSMQGDISGKAQAMAQSLADDFPMCNQAQEVSFTIGPGGVAQTQGGIVYQWVSIDDMWRVSLNSQSVALSCLKYTAFDDFAKRLQPILEAVDKTMSLPKIDRIGLRYVNQFAEAEFVAEPERFVDTNILGFPALKLPANDAMLVTGLCQAIYQVGDVALQARSAFVPAQQVFDPSIGQLAVPAWIVDLDGFAEGVRTFSLESIMETVGKLADMDYDFFKLIAQPALKERYGGVPA